MLEAYGAHGAAPAAAALLGADRAHARARAPDAAAAAALDAIDYGVLLLEAGSARLHFANRLAREECGAGGALVIEQQTLRARSREGQRKLDAALAQAACDRRSMIALDGGERDALLVVLPLAACEGEPPRALLLFARREVCEPLSIGFFARLHALTPAEEQVLKGLCRGLRPAQIAEAADVALSTVRSQVSSIRLKTGSQSIGELMHRVATLPPIPPALVQGQGRPRPSSSTPLKEAGERRAA